jgi:histidinol phosphatase-like enzyme
MEQDGTLIKTKSGNTFPKDAHDWVFIDTSVASKIREAHSDG